MNLFKDIDKEQDFKFNRSEIWLELGDIDDEFEEVLKPHSKIFINKLRPMWLFYLKNIQKLSFFDFVMARDGAMGLVKFFTDFPSPQGGRMYATTSSLSFSISSPIAAQSATSG